MRPSKPSEARVMHTNLGRRERFERFELRDVERLGALDLSLPNASTFSAAKGPGHGETNTHIADVRVRLLEAAHLERDNVGNWAWTRQQHTRTWHDSSARVP